jgi:hypothetical protein
MELKETHDGNSNYNVVFTGGKEFVLSKENDHTLLGFNLKVIYTGGFWKNTDRFFCITNAGRNSVPGKILLFSERNPNYFRIDAGMSFET